MKYSNVKGMTSGISKSNFEREIERKEVVDKFKAAREEEMKKRRKIMKQLNGEADIEYIKRFIKSKANKK